jgi:DNA-binding response OmpR family regulator
MEASQPGRILLIDDDPALGGYLTRVLTRGGFEVTHELDSASALLRVEEQDWDLLITDIELPGMNGLELLERVRQLVPSLPVAVLTGNPTVDYAVSALRSAAAEFLQKPIGAGDLITKAAELIRAGREARARGRELRPGVPALFMSGYAQPILDTHGIPSPHYDILEKPFTEAALLTRVRRALIRPAPAPAASPSPNPSLPPS